MKRTLYSLAWSVVGALIGMVVANALVNFSDADATRGGGFFALGMAMLFAVAGYRYGKEYRTDH